jgi:hypothetical protein
MNNSEILKIQIKSDLRSLEDDVIAGLYDYGNFDDLRKRENRIKEKIEKYKNSTLTIK